MERRGSKDKLSDTTKITILAAERTELEAGRPVSWEATAAELPRDDGGLD